MAKSLIELINITGDHMKIWQTDSDGAIFEAESPGLTKPHETMQHLLSRIDSLNLDSLARMKLHEYFGLPQNAVQFVPGENRVIVYADLVVPEFRNAEKLFFTSVIPARIRSSPSKEELELRAKRYGEHNEYRDNGSHIIAGEEIDKEVWGVRMDKRYSEYKKAVRTAESAIKTLAARLKNESPSFIENHGGYELFEYWTLEFADKKRFKHIYRKLADTPALTLTRKIE